MNKTQEQKPQRMQALEQANRARKARADLKRQVASGAISPADVILRPQPNVGSMPVAELLMSQSRWGKVRCRKALGAVPVPEHKPLEALTERQRERLAAQL